MLYEKSHGGKQYLFIAHGKLPRPGDEVEAPAARDVIVQENLQICIKGCWKPVLCDTLTGERKPMRCSYIANETWIYISCYAHDSLLFVLEPGRWSQEEMPDYSRYSVQAPYHLGRMSLEEADAPMVSPVPPQVPFTLSEPNVLVLDCAEYALDDEPYSDETEELLRLDNKLRRQLGIPIRKKQVSQPWILPKQAATHTENVFLLGDFCVRVEGSLTRIFPAREKIPFSDMTRLGYPFYGGNITYHLEVDSTEPELYIRCSKYRGTLITVWVDRMPMAHASVNGEKAGSIAFAPYQLKITGLEPGHHTIDLTLFGNRVNTFGALHNANEHFWWHGPEAYRTSRDEWSYEYQLKPMGILKCPEIFSDKRYAKV